MAVKVLVASPIPSFGELIRTTLNSQGDYQVAVCETGNQVLDALAGEVYDVLILDAALNDQPFAPLVQKITASLPSQKIAVIPPENKPDHPALENVTAHGFLFRPFLDPDLINLVQRLASAAELERNSQQTIDYRLQPEGRGQISWAEDPAGASAELSRLLLGSSALAGLVIRDGQIFIRAGRISAEASLEINQMLSQVKTDNEKDLVRFTFLVADDCEALVYAVNLASGWIMALVYDVSMPLTRVRSQATGMAARLREHITLADVITPSEEIAEIPPSPSAPVKNMEEGPGESATEDSGDVDISSIMEEIRSSKASDSDEFLNISSLDDELFSLINEVNETPKKETAGKAQIDDDPQNPAPIDQIYAQVQQPGGNVVVEGTEGGQVGMDDSSRPDEELVVEEPAEGSLEEQAEITAVSAPVVPIAEAWTSADATKSGDAEDDGLNEAGSILPDMPAVNEGELLEMEAALGQALEAPATDVQSIIDQHLATLGVGSQSGTRTPPGDIPSEGLKQPVLFSRIKTPDSEGKTMTVVFAPRSEGHYLTGDLAVCLGDLLKNASRANPWKLTGVSIRPEYLKISIGISEFLDPDEIIGFIKEYTGSAIKERFPDAAGGENDDPFWADEILTGSDGSPIEGQKLRDYLRSVRSIAAASPDH